MDETELKDSSRFGAEEPAATGNSVGEPAAVVSPVTQDVSSSPPVAATPAAGGGSQNSSEMGTVVTEGTESRAQDSESGGGGDTGNETTGAVPPAAAAASPASQNHLRQSTATSDALGPSTLTSEADPSSPSSSPAMQQPPSSSTPSAAARLLAAPLPGYALRAAAVGATMITIIVAYACVGAAIVSPDWASCEVTNALPFYDGSLSGSSSAGDSLNYVHSVFRMGLFWSAINVTGAETVTYIHTPRNIFDFANHTFAQLLRVSTRASGSYEAVSEVVANLGDAVDVQKDHLLTAAIFCFAMVGLCYALVILVCVFVRLPDRFIARVYVAYTVLSALAALMTFYVVVVGTTQLMLRAYTFSQSVPAIAATLQQPNPVEAPVPYCRVGIAQRATAYAGYVFVVAAFVFSGLTVA